MPRRPTSWTVKCRKCGVHPGQTCVTMRGKVPTASHAIRMDDAASPWGKNNIQFPRLLAEIYATVQFTPAQETALCESMDLDWGEVCQLLERADVIWQNIKERT